MTTNKFLCHSLSDLPEIAKQLIQLFSEKKIILFYGQMGAGKTTLITEICKQLGVNEHVTSPTFSLVNEYRDKNQNPVYHFDFYRINSETEVYDIGYEDYFYSGNLCLIEWADKIPNLIPQNSVSVFINVENEKRIISLM